MGTRLKMVFTFPVTTARQIRQLAEYEARQRGGGADTQKFLEQLIGRAHREMEDEQRAARKIRTCPTCGKVFSGNPACPGCGQWVS